MIDLSGLLNGVYQFLDLGLGVDKHSERSAYLLPAALRSRWVLPFKLYKNPDGSFTSDFRPELYIPSGTAVYIATTGNDTTGNGTEGNPYRTLAKGYDVGATVLYIKSGHYDYVSGLGASWNPTRSMALIAADGPGTVTISRAFNGLSWTQQSSPNTAVYLAACPVTPYRVVDTTAAKNTTKLLPNGQGVPIPYTSVASVAACQATAGTYYISGSNIYVHTHNNRAPDASVLVMPTQSCNWFTDKTDANKTIYMDGIMWWGVGGCRTEHLAANEVKLIAVDCHFGYGGNTLASVNIQGTQYCYFVRCGASDNLTDDGFSYSTSATQTALDNYTCKGYEDSCWTRRCGNTGAVNDNASTSHYNATVYRINGDYQETVGPSVADVLGSYTFCGNCIAGNSLIPTTNQARVAFQCGTVNDVDGVTASQMYLDECTSVGVGYAIGGPTGGTVYYKNHTISTTGEASPIYGNTVATW